MLRLDNTTRKLQVVLAGTVAAAQLPVMVAYSDKIPTAYTGAVQVSNTNSTVAVDICNSPAASTVRDIDYLSVRNSDTAAATVTIRYNDNAVLYTIVTATLSIGDHLVYVHGDGWKVLDVNGQTKTTALSGLIAANITNTPAGAIVATNVQAALNELDSEKLPVAGGTMTGALGIIAGTAAAPGLFMSGDTNTGVYFSAADTVDFATGGVNALKLTSTVATFVGAVKSPNPNQQITTGAAAVTGNATLVAGTVTVSTTAVKTASVVMLTRKTSGGTIGTAITYTISNGVSFTINSDNILDTSTFSWLIVDTY